MDCKYEFDQDPRYGWASIDLGDAKSGLIVIHGPDGSRGFQYENGTMTPACICHAYKESECGCPGVTWGD